MRVETSSLVRLGERYGFGFTLPSTTSPIPVESRALRLCPEPSRTYGFRIETLAQKDSRLVKHFILNQMSVEQRRVIQRAFKHLSTSVIAPFPDQPKVQTL